jgi:hypothetical protein
MKKKRLKILGLLVIIGVLYVASMGPAWALAKRGHIPKSAYQTVYLPLLVLEDHCPGNLLWRYENWWAPKMDIHL